MKKNNSLRKIIMLMLLLASLIFIDQFVKILVIDNLKGREPIVLIKDVFEFSFVGNKGIAWGMFAGKVNFVIIFTVAITIAIIALIGRLEIIKKNITNAKLIRKYSLMQVLLTFLVAGAVGNLIDRIRLGYVVDFLYFKLIDFPVFNIADIYVTCTIIVLATFFIFGLSEDEFSMIYSKNKQLTKGENNDSK